MAHLLISAAHKSSGKTIVTVGLAAALARRGHKVQTFKKGPDYIDPMWLARASGQACFNLDFYTMSEQEIRATFCTRAASSDIALIEGNKGLFDGLDPLGSDSNAALARLLDAPVVLVIDTVGMTRGIAPLIAGYQAFDPQVRIGGVILNRVGGPRHEGKLRAALEHYTDVPVLGAIGRNAGLEIAERHLGLIPANEMANAAEHVDRLEAAVEGEVDLDRLLEVAAAGRAPCAAAAPRTGAAKQAPKQTPKRAGVRIAVARDAAFGFYYPDDLEALEAAGAELVPFDSLNDACLPPVEGLFIGGGFPETHMAALEANSAMRSSIRSAVGAGMPTYAECGGLMYLARSLCWRGQTCEMAGVIPADAVMHAKSQGRGYMRLQETGLSPWPAIPAEQGGSSDFPAHEFHYASLENLPADTKFAYTLRRGAGIDGQHDGIVMGNLLANFCHLRNMESNRWAARFVDFVRRSAIEN